MVVSLQLQLHVVNGLYVLTVGYGITLEFTSLLEEYMYVPLQEFYYFFSLTRVILKPCHYPGNICLCYCRDFYNFRGLCAVVGHFIVLLLREFWNLYHYRDYIYIYICRWENLLFSIVVWSIFESVPLPRNYRCAIIRFCNLLLFSLHFLDKCHYIVVSCHNQVS